MAHSNSPSPEPTATQTRGNAHSLSIAYRPVADLRVDPTNARIHNKKQIRQIARSVETFGFCVPVLVDAQAQVIAGHGRLLAAQFLGMAQVPTISLEHLTEVQIQAFKIADNRLAENSAWDQQLLAKQFRALSTLDLNFSIEVTGFEMGEIDVMIEGESSFDNGKQDPADEIPDLQSKPTISHAADIWLMDRHRVLCGDAREESAYRMLMGDQRASAVFSDPPYNIPIDRYVTNFGETHHPEFAMGSGEMSSGEFESFLLSAFRLMARYSKDGALHYVCIDWRHTPEILAAGNRAFTELKNICVWIKNLAGQGSLYRSQHEFVFVFKNGKKPHRNNILLGQYGRYRTNVWHYARANSTVHKTTRATFHLSIPRSSPFRWSPMRFWTAQLGERLCLIRSLAAVPP
jgi:hypothetical protein